MASAQLAVLFADVCDSTTLYESIGDTRALAAISRLFGVLAWKVKARGGTVVKTLGDGMVCQFKDADGALAAACDMQAAATAAATAADAGAGPKLAIKVAFNWGPVVTEGDDVFGDTVNVCARLAGLAGAEQVLTTQETIDALSAPRGRSRPLHPLKIRGRVGEVRVCEVLWRSDEDSLVITKIFTKRQKAAPAREWILKLSYGGGTTVVEPDGSITLGRDKTNDVVVASEKASRVHARIYGRDGNFLIADRSSNGTFVQIDGSSRELTLRREEAVLGERGYIGLGGPASGDGDHVLRYRLENRKP
jgi:class 3 adenylate cyclase